jgi:hypothetical protein
VRRAKAYVCGLPIAGITRSNAVDLVDIRFLVFIVCCVCEELITRSENPFLVCVCPIVCVIETSNTGVRRITTFGSKTDRIHDGGPIILHYNFIIF